jgi:hypothetical protein
MNFFFVGFEVAGIEGRCMSYLQVDEYRMITNKPEMTDNDPPRP